MKIIMSRMRQRNTAAVPCPPPLPLDERILSAVSIFENLEISKS